MKAPDFHCNSSHFVGAGLPVHVEEFKTREDLEQISTDVELMRINSLLMAERILGSSHKDVIFRIMYRGAAYADLQLYPLCISLWIYALELRINKDSILYADSCFTALALVSRNSVSLRITLRPHVGTLL